MVEGSDLFTEIILRILGHIVYIDLEISIFIKSLMMMRVQIEWQTNVRNNYFVNA